MMNDLIIEVTEAEIRAAFEGHGFEWDSVASVAPSAGFYIKAHEGDQVADLFRIRRGIDCASAPYWDWLRVDCLGPFPTLGALVLAEGFASNMNSKQIYEVTVCESAVEFSERTYEVEASSPEEAQRIYASEGAESCDPKHLYTDNDTNPDEITSVKDSEGLECDIVPQGDSEDEEEQSLAQRLLGAFREIFAEVVDDWEDVYYGADPEEETEVWSRTDEAKEKGFERLEAIARGEEDPKTIEVKEDEDTLTFEEVEDGIVMCRFYMPLVHGDNPKRARQLLQRFIDFDDLGVDDSVSEDDGVWNDREIASAMGAMEDNSQDSRESGVPRSDIMALALFEILKKERITVRDDKGDYYTRDLVSEGDKRGKFGWGFVAKEAK